MEYMESKMQDQIEGAQIAREQACDDWVARCAARYQERAGMAPEEAKQAADASFENLGYDLTENPEDAADEDLTCWQD